jgi:hypothetical protein
MKRIFFCSPCKTQICKSVDAHQRCCLGSKEAGAYNHRHRYCSRGESHGGGRAHLPRFVSSPLPLHRHTGLPPFGRGGHQTPARVTSPPDKIGVVSNSRRWVFPRPETISWCLVRAGSRPPATCMCFCVRVRKLQAGTGELARVPARGEMDDRRQTYTHTHAHAHAHGRARTWRGDG